MKTIIQCIAFVVIPLLAMAGPISDSTASGLQGDPPVSLNNKTVFPEIYGPVKSWLIKESPAIKQSDTKKGNDFDPFMLDEWVPGKCIRCRIVKPSI